MLLINLDNSSALLKHLQPKQMLKVPGCSLHCKTSANPSALQTRTMEIPKSETYTSPSKYILAMLRRGPKFLDSALCLNCKAAWRRGSHLWYVCRTLNSTGSWPKGELLTLVLKRIIKQLPWRCEAEQEAFAVLSLEQELPSTGAREPPSTNWQLQTDSLPLAKHSLNQRVCVTPQVLVMQPSHPHTRGVDQATFYSSCSNSPTSSWAVIIVALEDEGGKRLQLPLCAALRAWW